ncbi:MAG: hypothetical protein KJ566_02960 [Nanoarchaeota archaeon]|nr:hypothetical protein [Nanoarchaeota archaeon]
MLNKNLTTKIPENLDNWNAINYPINEPNHERIYTVSSEVINVIAKTVYFPKTQEDVMKYLTNLEEGDLQYVRDVQGKVHIIGLGKNIETKIESLPIEVTKPRTYLKAPSDVLPQALGFWGK